MNISNIGVGIDWLFMHAYRARTMSSWIFFNHHIDLSVLIDEVDTKVSYIVMITNHYELSWEFLFDSVFVSPFLMDIVEN